MKRFLKITLVVTVVLAFIVPVALNYLVSGRLADREQLAAVTQPGFEVLDASVERAVFSSKQTLTLRPNDTPGNAWINDLLGRSRQSVGADLVVRNVVRPGPVPIGPPGEGAFRPAFANARSEFAIREAGGAETPLPGAVYTRVTPMGSRHRYVLDEGKVLFDRVDEALNVGGRGIDLDLRLGAKSRLDGRIDALEVSSGADAITVSELALESSNRLGERVTQFAAHLTAKQLGATTDDGRVSLGLVKDLDVQTEMGVDGDTGHVALKASGDGIADGKKADFDVDLRYDTTATALHTLTSIAGAMVDAPAASTRDLDRLLRDFSALLRSGGHLQVDKLLVDTDEGAIIADVDLELAPGATTPLAALAVMEGGGKFQIPVTLIRELQKDRDGAGPNIDIALQLRLLRREGQSYKSEFTLRNGLLKVNGIPLPIPLLSR